MNVNEKKMQIVIDNYFKKECDVNTSIKSAFEKGFKIIINFSYSEQWSPRSDDIAATPIRKVPAGANQFEQ